MPRDVFICCTLALGAGGAQAGAEALSGPVTIPIEIVSGYPVLVARIADRDLPLMLDLGGYEHITLTKEAMRVSGVVALSERDQHKDAQGNLIEAARFRVKELKLGDATFTDVDGHVAAFAAAYPAAPIGNVGRVGRALLSPYSVLIDYAAGRLTLLPADARAERRGCRGTPVPFASDRDDTPASRAKTDLGTLTFVWDTGTPRTIIRTSLVASGEDAPERFRTTLFELGGTDFGPLDLEPFAFVEPAGADGFIGGDFFATHVVCVDFARRRVLVRRAGAP
jgi:hypothetical protein